MRISDWSSDVCSSDLLWIRAVMRVESRGDARAISPKGAIGLMQVMPATWTEMRTRYALGPDPYDPRDNILAGAAYLREMHDRYGSPGFLRSEEHTSELQSLMRTSYAVFCLKTKNIISHKPTPTPIIHITRHYK